jgi:5,10-methylenetetrahydromethanopterin reductase
MPGPHAAPIFSLTVMALDPPGVFCDLTRAAEDGGFANLWVADSSLHARDVYGYLALAATRTARVRLGPNCTHPYTRHPAVNLNAVCTLDEISGGRAMLNFGAGDRPVMELGYAPAKMAVVREAFLLMRRLLRGEPVTADGPLFRLQGAALPFHPRADLPMYITASGPKVLEMAGELADGATFLCGPHPACVRFAVERLRAGLARAGRGADGFDMACSLYGSLREDEVLARAESRAMAAWFPQTAPWYAELAGMDPALIARIRAAYQGGHFDQARDAGAMIADEMMDRFVVAGNAAHWRAAIAQVLAAGVRHINVFAISKDRLGMVRALAADVLPHFH